MIINDNHSHTYTHKILTPVNLKNIHTQQVIVLTAFL